MMVRSKHKGLKCQLMSHFSSQMNANIKPAEMKRTSLMRGGVNAALVGLFLGVISTFVNFSCIFMWQNQLHVLISTLVI